MLIDLLCPIELQGTVVKTNSETNEPYLLLNLFNKSNKTIDSVTFNVKVYDANSNELAVLPVEYTELDAQPQELFAETKAISLAEIPDAQNFVVEFLSAVYSDGEQYEYSEENFIDCDTSEAALADALKLRESFPDAVCFAKDHGNYWRCACGTPNLPDSEVCSNCANTKDYMLTSFSSLEALEDMLAKKREAEEAEKAAKKAKTKKGIITTIIVIIVIAIIAVAGYFARNLILGLQAGSAAKSGDYTKAYDLYSKTNNSKAAEFEQHAMGNTPSNLMFGNGFTAEDNENLYFLTYEIGVSTMNLIKENKATGEKTILTDAAVSCLNVVGDYIYFINNEYKPCRMTKDGNNTEIIFDKTVDYLCVIGSDLYYIATDFDDAGDLTEEQLMALASQGQIESHKRIHKYNLNTKKDVVVSKEDVSTFAIYNSRIYYLTSGSYEDMWNQSHIYSMDMNGEDIKKHVEVPSMTFAIHGDDLYYIAHYVESAKGSEISDFSLMDYSLMKLNLATGEKVPVSSPEDMIVNVNISGDMIYFVRYNRTEYVNYASGIAAEGEEITEPSTSLVSINMNDGRENILLTGDVASFNVSGEDIFCVMPQAGGMARLKTDGSGFDAVYSDGTSTPTKTAAESTELSPDLQALAEDIEAEAKSEAEAPAEEVPVEEAPAEEVPVEEAPAETEASEE